MIRRSHALHLAADAQHRPLAGADQHAFSTESASTRRAAEEAHVKPLVRLRMPILAAALGLPLAAAAQTMKWDLATGYSDSEFQTRNVRMFADDVKKRSAGKLEIMVHSAQSLIK